MPDLIERNFCRARRTFGSWWAAWLLAVLQPSCRCESSPSPPKAVRDAGAAAAACALDPRTLTLAARARTFPGDESAYLDAPIEIGMGVHQGGLFFVTAIRRDDSGAMALLALFGDGDSGVADRVVELGPLHGDTAVPRLAFDDRQGVVAVQEATAGGHQVRVGRLSLAGQVTDWRLGPHQDADESSAFDVAAARGAVLIAWDEWRPADNHGVVRVAELRWPAPAPPVEPRPIDLSGTGVDAESPRIVPRPGGYWAAWIVNAPRDEGAGVYDPDQPPDDLSPGSSLSHGPRWIEVVPLDERGARSSAVVGVTPRDARVAAFDLAPSPDGGARLVWREGAASPAASGGQVATLSISDSGPGPVRVVADSGVGAGAPSWLPAGPGDEPWLALTDERDAPSLLRWSSRASEPRRIATSWTGAAALAARGRRLLVALPRARGVELALARCR